MLGGVELDPRRGLGVWENEAVEGKCKLEGSEVAMWRAEPDPGSGNEAVEGKCELEVSKEALGAVELGPDSGGAAVGAMRFSPLAERRLSLNSAENRGFVASEGF